MAEKYGFYTEQYESGSIATLMTGDGKSIFSDIYFDDGKASIGFSYDDKSTANIGDKQHFNDGTLATDIDVKFQVKFECVESVDSMIETLMRVRAKIVNPISTGA